MLKYLAIGKGNWPHMIDAGADIVVVIIPCTTRDRIL